MNITENFVDGLALNAAAMKNGRDLVKKNSFPALHISGDKTLLFGACKGSGKDPYQCSVDFSNESQPVFRCTCPSRQFPCKHNLGLLYAYTGGKSFVEAPIPQDITDKREKVEKREERKREVAAAAETAEAEGTEAPVRRKTNTSALVKKIAVQLDGIGLAEKLVLQLVQAGLGSIDKKMLKTMEDQTKEVGNYYIPGIQYALREVLMAHYANLDAEAVYTSNMESLQRLHTGLKKAKDYLQARALQPERPMETETAMEEWIGHAWQIAELREHGRASGRTELMQLAFHSYTDQPRGEYIDEGVWANLQTGEMHHTRTYRPFRAAKYIREDDSCFEIVAAKELFRYPGERNTRVRWEESTTRPTEQTDYEAVLAFAERSYPDVIKQVKNQIKNPLSDKHPVVLLRYEAIERVGETIILVDEQGKQLQLADSSPLGQSTTELLPLLHDAYMKRQAMLVLFEHRIEENRLVAQPLSIVTANGLLRLLY
ncbi:SWIM zinc finger family protein [Paenibacillus koleovorans]|uniref:SWIM zinc finger family protein n=1 Tax=Paenibacillus koleovorans TaxID=121608 RepID=UPI000FDB511D|nr:SWIM zinc finger family protein [Paenibacillus koleovorans]